MHSFYVPILNDEYGVGVAWGNEAFLRKTLGEYGYPDADTVDCGLNNHRGKCVIRDGCHPVILLPKKPKGATEIGTLCHEATHAIEHIFEQVDQPIGGEIFAHSIEAVVRHALYEKTQTQTAAQDIPHVRADKASVGISAAG